MHPFLWVFLGINILTVGITVYDKRVAHYNHRHRRHRRQRVPEQLLWILAVLGGSIAMYLTMSLIRHKTKHKTFMLGLPVIMLIQIAILYITL